VRRAAFAGVLVCLLAALLAVLAESRAARSRPVAALTLYGGLGTWVDIYDLQVWRNPVAALTAMKARGVRTLYLETSNYRAASDVVRPAGTARILEAAHALGLKVVAWYLPGFLNPARDTRRTLAAVRFRTPRGQRFDSFALDIEAPVVRSVPLRTARLLRLSSALRRAVGPSYALGAIIPAPRGMQILPRYWPGFPYRQLAATYDIFLPMAYFTYRARNPATTYDYTVRNVAIIRRATANAKVPIHMIGGVAENATARQVRGFVRAARDCGVMGASVYDFLTTSVPHWAELRTFSRPPVRPRTC
jgi:hypothetical protein